LRYLIVDYAFHTDQRELYRGTVGVSVTPRVFDLLDESDPQLGASRQQRRPHRRHLEWAQLQFGRALRRLGRNPSRNWRSSASRMSCTWPHLIRLWQECKPGPRTHISSRAAMTKRHRPGAWRSR